MRENNKQAYLAAEDASLSGGLGHGGWANARQDMTMLNKDVWETRVRCEVQHEPNICEQATVNNRPLLFFVFTCGSAAAGGAALLREEPCPAIQTMAGVSI